MFILLLFTQLPPEGWSDDDDPISFILVGKGSLRRRQPRGWLVTGSNCARPQELQGFGPGRALSMDVTWLGGAEQSWDPKLQAPLVRVPSCPSQPHTCTGELG